MKYKQVSNAKSNTFWPRKEGGREMQACAGCPPGGSGSRDHGVDQAGDDDRAAQEVTAGDGALLHQRHLLWGHIQPQVPSAEYHGICQGRNCLKILQAFAVLCLHNSRQSLRKSQSMAHHALLGAGMDQRSEPFQQPTI